MPSQQVPKCQAVAARSWTVPDLFDALKKGSHAMKKWIIGVVVVLLVVACGVAASSSRAKTYKIVSLGHLAGESAARTQVESALNAEVKDGWDLISVLGPTTQAEYVYGVFAK
jgi:hypothetical protein